MSAAAEGIARILARDLGRLIEEVEAYAAEDDLWRSAPGIHNSGGVLANHLAGNLLHFVGAVLGQTGYVRDREAEFEATGVPRTQLVARIRRARVVVEEVVPELDAEDLAAPFPDAPTSMQGISTRTFLVHLTSHLAYHLGQVNYHRRIL